MYVQAWRQALRRFKAEKVLSSLATDVEACQYRYLHNFSGGVRQKGLQPVSRGGLHPAVRFPYAVRNLNTFQPLQSARSQNEKNQELAKQEEDPFESLTDRIPEKPVTVAEGASYGVVILAGLAVAGAAAYAVFKELVFQPKEYKIFGKALERVQKDNQVTVRLGSPITGYGQESRNRGQRQRISNRTWTDEDGVERCEVVFFIRGPQGSGKVHSEMFKDTDRNWKFTYLIVDVTNPYPTRLMLESYIPNMPAVSGA